MYLSSLLKYLVLISICYVNVLFAQNQAFIKTSSAVEEIDFLIRNIEEIHYNPYFKHDKNYVNLYKESLISEFHTDSISYRQYIAFGMKLTSLLSGGHTAFDWQNHHLFPEFSLHMFLPFTGVITEDDDYLVITQSYTSDFSVGQKVECINDFNIKELFQECKSFIGGIDSFKNAVVEKMFPVYLFFVSKFNAPYNIKLENYVQSKVVNGLEIDRFSEQLQSSISVINYDFNIFNENTGILSYNRCENYDAFDVFLERTFETIKREKLQNLIIDIRENGGGDSSLNDLLLNYVTQEKYRQSSGRYWKVSNQAKEFYKEHSYENYFGQEFMSTYYEARHGDVLESLDYDLVTPEKVDYFFEGNVYLWIGPSTYSSANFLADAFKTYSIGTIIGMPTGENANDFGEQIQIRLPHSDNLVFISSTYDIGANGNELSFEPIIPDYRTIDAMSFTLNLIENQ